MKAAVAFQIIYQLHNLGGDSNSVQVCINPGFEPEGGFISQYFGH